MTWDNSKSAGNITYKIVRKENAAAVSDSDPASEIIGTAGTNEFLDANLKPGVHYYYNVYAVRSGVVSNPGYADAVNLADIKITKKEEGNGYIRVEWDPLGNNAKILVYRSENQISSKDNFGEPIRVNGNYILDNTVENDKSYYYLFSVSYHIGEKTRIRKTSVGPFIPMSLPEPIGDLAVKSLENDTFEACWTNLSNEKVVLYYTDKRISLGYGDVTNVDKVNELLNPVDSISYTHESCNFRIHDNKKYAIIPVSIKNSVAVIGEQAAAVKMEKISVETMEMVNDNLRVVIKWPKDAVSILAIYGTQGYAKNLEDRKGKTVRSIPKKQYEADSGLYLKNVRKDDCYITLYSVLRLNGEMVYSEGTQVLFSNKPKVDIQYSIKVKGFMNKQVEVGFSSQESSFTLPEIDLVSKQGGPPVYVTSGTIVEHIEKQNVNKNFKVTFPANKVPKNSYLKAFFSDENMNDEISLKPMYGTNFKIN